MEEQNYLPVRRKYKQDWHKYHLAKTQEKRLFYQLLYELCQIIPEPKQDMGRKRAKLGDLIFSLGVKLYSNYSGRKTCSDLVHAEKAGFISKAHGVNTINDFLNCEATYDLLLKLLTISAMPLKNIETDFAMDSSGFGSYQYERWIRVRFQKNPQGNVSKRGWRNYVKAHIVIGTRTNVIVSAEITYGNLSDVRQAPKILESLRDNFNPKRVSGDKAYSSHRVHQIIQSLGAIPYIPFKINVNPNNKKAPKIWTEMYNYFKENREEFMKCYHKRSNVETTFSMIKTRLGEFLKCKKFESQRNELVMKLICHNICCLIQELFEREVNIDFKKCLMNYINRKVDEEDKTRDVSNPDKKGF